MYDEYDSVRFLFFDLEAVLVGAAFLADLLGVFAMVSDRDFRFVSSLSLLSVDLCAAPNWGWSRKQNGARTPCHCHLHPRDDERPNAQFATNAKQTRTSHHHERKRKRYGWTQRENVSKVADTNLDIFPQEKEDVETRSPQLPRRRLVCSSQSVVSAVTFDKESLPPVWEPEHQCTLQQFWNISALRSSNLPATPRVITRRAVLVSSRQRRFSFGLFLISCCSSASHYACHQER